MCTSEVFSEVGCNIQGTKFIKIALYLILYSYLNILFVTASDINKSWKNVFRSFFVFFYVDSCVKAKHFKCKQY